MDGAEQTYVSDTPNAMNEFAYQSASDRLDVYIGGSSVADMNSRNWEESMDFSTLKTAVVNESSDLIRSYINRPIYRRKNADLQGASSRDYDFILVRINALLAAADLVRRFDEEKADEIYAKALSPDGDGLLDRLKRGDFALWHETTNRSEDGIVQVVSINGSTTGYPRDIKMYGPPNVDYDEVRLVIETGGTFAPGVSSPVKFDVYVKNDNGLRMQKVVDAETMNGSYQTMAYGAMVAWQPGVYVASDEFSVIFQSSDVAIGSVKSSQIYR
ncbi:MAG TPA: hypothetical protein DG048_11720 [Pseudoalteromonas sp.]|nr:hypothetical protein [Pseudoalteromonas sp.]|tara:strand:- start:2270 stop:3085 length:816 start_codon:yes stop_codon:yes gene_type:complete